MPQFLLLDVALTKRKPDTHKPARWLAGRIFTGGSVRLLHEVASSDCARLEDSAS